MDIGGYIKQSWQGTIDNVVNLWVAGIIVGILSFITLGILGGVLIAGWLMMYVKLYRDGKKPEIADVFAYFNQFAPLFLLWLVVAGSVVVVALVFVFLLAKISPMLIMPGMVIVMGCGIILCTILFYSFALIADQGKGVKEAILESKDKVMSTSFPMHLILVVVIAVISAIGGLIPYLKYVLAPFTYSIGLGVVAAAYLDQFKK